MRSTAPHAGNPAVEAADRSETRSRSRPGWWRLYFVLAAFDVATICFSLHLNHRLIEIHDRSVVVNQEWADRLTELAELTRLAAAVNAPGNDVFDSHDIEGEWARLRTTRTRFDDALAAAAAATLATATTHGDAAPRDELAALELAMDRMVDEAEHIFGDLRAGDPKAAGGRMATMDRRYADVHEAFLATSRRIREIQTRHFRRQQADSALMRSNEHYIAGAVILIVIAVALYGHRMGRAVAAAHDDLEARVASRTSELRAEIVRREAAQREADEAHRRMLSVTRQAGMAEVAVAVLHNVGNVLNSVNVSTATVRELLRKSKVTGLARAVALLEEHRASLGDFLTSDARGRQVPQYLRAVSDALVREQSTLLRETDALDENVEHLKHVVAMQEARAAAPDVSEALDAHELVDEALASCAEDLAEVDVERDYDEVPRLWADRHKAVRILIALLRNARDSRDPARRPALRVTVSGAGPEVAIAVTDNGVGVSAERLASLFSFVETLRGPAHAPGLHAAANAAREMRGTLRAESAGAGLGATLVLRLPRAPAAAETAPPTLASA